jgi:Ca2+-binding RTX toxin-like protein
MILLCILFLCGYNANSANAQVPNGENALQTLIPSSMGLPDIDVPTNPSTTSIRLNEIRNIIDNPGNDNRQFCFSRHINSGSSTSSIGTFRCELSTEQGDTLSSLGRNALIFCPPSILLPIPCVGTEDDDIIYADRTTNEIIALRGNDIVFANSADTRIYGGKDDDLLIAGPGNDLVDGGPNDDVLLAGAGSDLLVGGRGNDKLFNGAGTSVMYGGKGANHFDCTISALGLARSVVMDYNPSKGDTIAGPCKLVNTLDDSNNSERIKGIPQTPLPDTGETSTGSNNEIIAGSLQ